MDIPLCPICLSTMDEPDKIYKLDCNHKFHTDCIIEWFRKSKGNCPCCMDNPYLDKNVKQGFYYGSWNHMYINERCSTLRKQTRKKNCHPKIKKKFENLRIKEKELKEIKKERSEYLKSDKYKEQMDYKKKLDAKLHNKTNSILKCKTKIIADLPSIQNI